MQGDQPLEKLGNNLLGFLARFRRGAGRRGLHRRSRPISPVRRLCHFRGRQRGHRASRRRLGRPGRQRQARASGARCPRGYLPISSGIGKGTPNELVVVPASIDGVVQAVLELGFFGATDADQRELLSRVSESIAVAVRAAKDRQRLEELLQETQQQAEELQAGAEELRVSNEELEEQGRALRESQAHLEVAAGRARADQLAARGAGAAARAPEGRARQGAGRCLTARGGRAAAGERVQERVPREHEPRAAHAAQLDPDPGEAAGRQQGRQPDRRAGEVRPDHHLGRQRSARAHQRHPRSVEDRGGQGRAGARARSRWRPRSKRCVKTFQPTADQKRLRFCLGDRAGRARADRDRSAAARPDPQEPAVERVQVHREGRGRVAGILAAERRPWHSPCATPASASRRISRK